MQKSPFLDINYGWNYGEDGWNIGMDENLLKMSFLHLERIDFIVDVLPSTSNSLSYFLTTDKKLYFSINNAWYSSPTPLYKVINVGNPGIPYVFNGSQLVRVFSQADLENNFSDINESLANKVDKENNSRLITNAEATKLQGIQNNATANQTDTYLLSRANHTGTQPISSVTDLQSSLNAREYVLTAGANISIDRTNPTSPIISAIITGVGQWETKAVGEVFALWDHITGVSVPPTNNPSYRFIRLTAADSYNSGVFTTESVTGQAPLVQATAVISDSGSPLNGQTVRLINTERRVIKAGSSGTVESDAIQNVTGSFVPAGRFDNTGFNAIGTGPFVAEVGERLEATSGTVTGAKITFDMSRSARTATETRSKNIGATYYMRIR